MLRCTVIGLLLCSVGVLETSAAQPTWEAAVPQSQVQVSATVERGEQESIEIYTKDGYVYISTSQPVKVKIFSILGQLISQESVPVGTYRLRINSRGIYILKAGTITRRITI